MEREIQGNLCCSYDLMMIMMIYILYIYIYMEYMGFNQRGDISTLNHSSLKLVDKFTYLGNSLSSIETDINMQLVEA